MELLQLFRIFIEDSSRISDTLTYLTKKCMGTLKRDKSSENSFQGLKKAISSALILMFPNCKNLSRGHIEASGTNLG